ncbi:Zinc-ribbon containing domain-containing protein [Desulfuromusa kysingii]|uniref:Zinc-ribbon containing domain-containing protein n=1 Tax=Desulfuromusa kysingii TaxID=37625 RepID=A0A1H4BE32_9BACT|nr:hypothetical protein [Desulfuromusa kysingii]SEA46082.1 Zinc-ribbon containing domain-containing protein [Desulfuromusa kysingii]
MTENNQPKQEQEDVTVYEKIVSRTEELLEGGRKNLDEALKKASDELSSAGTFTREQAEKISSYVRRDLEHAFANAKKGKETVKEAVDPKRIVAGAQSLFSKVLLNASETLSDWAKKSEQQLEYKTGEVTSPGTLTCKNCKEEIHMRHTGRIPPCPKCHETRYRKSY